MSVVTFTSSYCSWTCLLVTIFLFLNIPINISSSQSHIPPIVPTCRDKCGNLTIKYPFGSDFGCGHPDFSRYIKCTSGGSDLRFSSGTGDYTVSTIDYTTSTLVLSDLFMSTCSSMQNSGSFRLDRGSPFTLSSQNIFILLGCSRTSPVFDPNEDLCDTGSGLHLCRGMYSCEGVSGIGLEPNGPISSCCVYQQEPMMMSLDLPKLQCSSYASMYGFGGDETDPMKWQFGISLEYNDSYYSSSSETCKSCEASGGFCGFAAGGSFSCICRGGGNSTTNCYGRGYAWTGSGNKFQTKISFGGTLFFWMLLLL